MINSTDLHTFSANSEKKQKKNSRRKKICKKATKTANFGEFHHLLDQACDAEKISEKVCVESVESVDICSFPLCNRDSTHLLFIINKYVETVDLGLRTLRTSTDFNGLYLNI